MLGKIWFWRDCLGNERNDITVHAKCVSKNVNTILYTKWKHTTRLHNNLLIENSTRIHYWTSPSGGFRGGRAAPSPFGRRTDAVTHGTPDMWQRYCIMAIPSPFLSLQARKTWYSEYSKWLLPVWRGLLLMGRERRERGKGEKGKGRGRGEEPAAPFAIAGCAPATILVLCSIVQADFYLHSGWLEINFGSYSA